MAQRENGGHAARWEPWRLTIISELEQQFVGC
jgi:hypothetical protein